jgi:hypothetical protein
MNYVHADMLVSHHYVISLAFFAPPSSVLHDSNSQCVIVSSTANLDFALHTVPKRKPEAAWEPV